MPSPTTRPRVEAASIKILHQEYIPVFVFINFVKPNDMWMIQKLKYSLNILRFSMCYLFFVIEISDNFNSFETILNFTLCEINFGIFRRTDKLDEIVMMGRGIFLKTDVIDKRIFASYSFWLVIEEVDFWINILRKLRGLRLRIRIIEFLEAKILVWISIEDGEILVFYNRI